MKTVLLVFDDPKELDFIESNLLDNGFEIFKASTLMEADKIAKSKLPELIVLNTANSETDLCNFSAEIRKERLENVSILSLIELEDYLDLSDQQHFIIKPVRPKLLLSIIRGIMNDEDVKWLPAVC